MHTKYLDFELYRGNPSIQFRVKKFRILIPWKNCFICCLCTFLYCSSRAQTTPLQSFTYDTLITGSGNDAYSFSVPKFNPSLGTLSSVDIRSVVSVNYGFVMTSHETSPVNFSVNVGRSDDFASPLLGAHYGNDFEASVGTYVVNPNQTISQAPATVIYRHNNNLSVSKNLNNFVGSDRINFNYGTFTYTDHSGSSYYSYSASANDTIHFTVTYFFYDPVVLATDLTGFSASKEDHETVKLSWTIANEKAGRSYEIQKSMDGSNFSAAGSLSSIDHNTDYSYSYSVQNDERKKLYFRLKITDAAGNITFSEIKAVDMFGDNGKSWYLYPNPSARFINIVFDGFKNWQVDILAANGNLVQSNRYSNAGTAHIEFNRTLARGVYFARVMEEQSKKTHVLSFVVQ